VNAASSSSEDIDPQRGSAHDDAAEIARLKREMALRDDILSMAAHELRNPLHALALHLALARALAQTGAPEVGDRIARAELALKRYSERVTVLLDLLASAAGEYPQSPRRVELGTLLANLVQTLDQEALARGIALRAECESACTLNADPVVLEQIVDNLALNAFKHSGATAVTLRCRQDAGRCVVEVVDNGRGIAPQDRSAIFEKFAVARHTPRGTGTGLGLWIVTRLVHTLGGSLRLLDAPGGGSVFRVEIPEGFKP
jgi:signal transduction histidine kinase